MPGFLDRHRAARLMESEGLAALVLSQPESISYAAGAFPGVATFWRRAGAAFLIVPADPRAPLTAIVGDLQARNFAAQSGISDTRAHRIWVESTPSPFAGNVLSRQPRPGQFNLAESLSLLHDALGEKGLTRQRIGLELGFVPVADFAHFQALPFVWSDCTRLVERLRAVKSLEEIAMLRRAADYSSAGLAHLLGSITPGMTASEMAAIWKERALATAAAQGEPPPQSTWAYVSVAGDGFAPGGPVQPGDIIKIDVGCVIDGYSSDGARTAVLGRPSAQAQRIHDVLLRAFETGLALIRPGTPLKDIYRAIASSVWEQGFPSYARGHFGHGVGSSVWSEEWPFIAADADAVLEPGMVMAFETPWYIDGLGGFIIEDQLLITETGHEVMAPLPRELFKV